MKNIACAARGFDWGGGGGEGDGGERSGSERRSHKENAAHGRVRQTKPPATQAIRNKSLPLFYRHFFYIYAPANTLELTSPLKMLHFVLFCENKKVKNVQGSIVSYEQVIAFFNQ